MNCALSPEGHGHLIPHTLRFLFRFILMVKAGTHSHWLLYVPTPPWASCCLGVGGALGYRFMSPKLSWNSGLWYQPQLAGAPSWTRCFYGKHVPVGDPPLIISPPPLHLGVHRVTPLVWPPAGFCACARGYRLCAASTGCNRASSLLPEMPRRGRGGLG